MSPWSNDLWEDISEIQDIKTRETIIRLYRLILDLHNKDILSDQIATALKGERKIYLTVGQKLGGIALGILMAIDSYSHLFH